MSIPRVYCPRGLADRDSVQLDARAAHHLIRVLRLGRGAEVALFDGEGREYAGVLATTSPRNAQVIDLRLVARELESPLPVTLAQGVARGQRMDYALQKAVELGVSAIVPVITERSAAPGAGRDEAKRAHWQGVVVSACEQCGRARVPSLAPLIRLEDWLGSLGSGLRLILSPRGRMALGELDTPGRVALLVGPEGGFTGTEQAQAEAAGFVPIRLGPRILRTETASAAGLAAIQAMWGDWR
jgi:16S rRNA (uracil1498-N3)-methyltransferase